MELRENGDNRREGIELKLAVDEVLLEVQVSRLLLCGAKVVKEAGVSFFSGRREAIMRDPEGHIFVIEESDDETELRRSLDIG